jgi:hypothetical protein
MLNTQTAGEVVDFLIAHMDNTYASMWYMDGEFKIEMSLHYHGKTDGMWSKSPYASFAFVYNRSNKFMNDDATKFLSGYIQGYLESKARESDSGISQPENQASG